MNRYEVSRSILDTYVQDIHLHHPMSGYRSIRDFLAFDNFLVMKPAERLLKRQRVPNTKSFCTAARVYSTHLLVIATYLQDTMRSKVCQDPEPSRHAVMESFWGRFKDTLKKHFRYWEKDDLMTVIGDYIHYFNYIRPVRKLDGKPPVLFRTELVA